MIKIIKLILEFLNDNLGLITLSGGVVIIFLYFKQKKDYKRDAARLILQEIRYAEQQIRNARIMGVNYYLADKLLPTNSWHKNIHLFMNSLKETQIDLISRFYSHATYLDDVIKIISDFKNHSLVIEKSLQQTTELQQVVPQQQALDSPEITSPQATGQQIISPPHIAAFKELAAQEILKDVSHKIEFLYNTPAVDKLRKISEKKWYQIF